MPSPRLLIIDFLSSDRFGRFRNEQFPYIQALCASEGVAVRWLAFGFEPSRMPTNRFRVALEDQDAEQLTAAVADFRPTHVLHNEKLDPTLAERLEPLLGELGATVAWSPELLEDAGHGRYTFFMRIGDVRRWLGYAPAGPEPADERFLFDAVAPDYGCELMNTAARDADAMVPVIAGPSCLYMKRVDRVPDYADLSLETALRDRGCSFCRGPATLSGLLPENDVVALALRQIRAAERTAPGGEGHRQYNLIGAALSRRIGSFVDALLAGEREPSNFFLTCRFDELLAMASDVEERLPALRDAGHSLSFATISVESFAPDENRRFNKGIEPAQVEAGVALLARWQTDFPDTVHYERYGGFGLILFTPWTRPEDVRLNLQELRRFGFPPQSRLLWSRLQLLPGTAITLLAQRDGVLVDRFADPAAELFDSGCLQAEDDHELPWRFLDPRVAAYYSVGLRACQDPSMAVEDELADRVEALLRRVPSGEAAHYDFLVTLLDAAEDDDPLALVERAEAALEGTLVAAPRLVDDPGGVATGDPPEDAKELAAGFVKAFAIVIERRPELTQGFVLEEARAAVHPEHGWSLRLRLAAVDVKLELDVLPRGGALRPYFETEHFALYWVEGFPLDTPVKERVARLSLQVLERVARAQASPIP